MFVIIFILNYKVNLGSRSIKGQLENFCSMPMLISLFKIQLQGKPEIYGQNLKCCTFREPTTLVLHKIAHMEETTAKKTKQEEEEEKLALFMKRIINSI